MLKPTKFLNLEKAQKLGIEIPETLFLSEKILKSEILELEIKKFLDKNKSHFYIIRSCIFGEDGDKKSFAGHFKSSEKIKAQNVLEITQKYSKKNKKIQKKILSKGRTNLMLQTFIEADFGGVIFSRWKYFSHHFLGEVSFGGSQKSVEGRDSDFFLMGKENLSKSQEINPLNSPCQGDLKEDFYTAPNRPFKGRHLSEFILKLEKIFDFPMDIEWCVKDEEIFILQIRPITNQIQALKSASVQEISGEKKYLENFFYKKSSLKILKKKNLNFEINSFSESFGVISPLSFEIIKSCFKNNLENFRDLGFRAENFNFLVRSRNGQIYAEVNTQKEFFKFKSFFTPFWQKIHEKKFLESSLNFLKNSEKKIQNSNFDLKNLSEIFGFWNIANIYAQQEKNIFLDETFLDEYEILKVLNINFPDLKGFDNFLNKEALVGNKFSQKISWAEIRNFYKKLWLYEYDKLKRIISQNPDLAFANIFELEEVLKNNLEKTFKNLDNLNKKLKISKKLEQKLIQKYKQELPFSILDFPSNFAEKNLKNNKNNSQKTCLVKGIIKNKKIFVVKNPKTFRGKFPQDCILVAPYFKNSWILEIDTFSGIILEQGGILSHSAIVAREKNISYFIAWNKATEVFKTGELFEI